MMNHTMCYQITDSYLAKYFTYRNKVSVRLLKNTSVVQIQLIYRVKHISNPYK